MQTAETVRVIADGGTRGLLYALCVAVIALTGAIVWLVKVHLASRDRREADMDTLRKEHVETLKQLGEAHAEAISVVQEARVDEMKAIVTAAGSINDAIDRIATRRQR